MILSVWNWCLNSATIVWARLQVFLGALFAVLAAVDLSPLAQVVPGRWSPLVLVVTGLITEACRRRTCRRDHE